ncbi:MAG: DUF3793 family protein [Oscillospiraceae bacterium]|nr:DUF3793 family protein [Oscillospiraceae bacterium]
MSEETIVRHCSPTLAGLKTANLFGCVFRSKEEMREDLRALNGILRDKGLRILPLRYDAAGGRALLYLYRPAQLARDLRRTESTALLTRQGYRHVTGDRALAELACKLRDSETFPHEIGLFLGYPPEDVQGFLEQRPCKCVGFWKVYGDADKAQRTFARYRRCTACYLEQLRNGKGLAHLAVERH